MFKLGLFYFCTEEDSFTHIQQSLIMELQHIWKNLMKNLSDMLIDCAPCGSVVSMLTV